MINDALGALGPAIAVGLYFAFLGAVMRLEDRCRR